MNNKADINETVFFEQYPDVFEMLLKDHTTGRNIFWATDSYAHLGKGYQFNDEITTENVTGEHGMIIRPRVLKEKEEQKGRTKGMAEVFTPSWVCNAQSNLVDNAWFGREDVFNHENDDRTWTINTDKIIFPEDKTWHDYVRDTRLEITCGEAPYLVSRYDTTTGQFIALENRIGLLDRKLRIVSENTETSGDWLKWARVAYENIYGYEWQGDSLLLAREALLASYMEYYYAKLGEMPSKESLLDFANIVSWNIWQMDGLKCVVPNSCKPMPSPQRSLFDEPKMIPCEGCKKGNMHKHNGIYCKIMDWEINEPITFVSLLKNEK